MKLLITGGPVYAKLDDVKIITNRFKGGLMSELASLFLRDTTLEIIYLCSKHGSMFPQVDNERFTLVFHDGFDDYRNKVLEYSKTVDGIILGAAVANLIPVKQIKGKFPSHNYKVGDIIPINFTIAPRIINEVKKVNPNVKLFGFKLLSNVTHEELVDAAYGVLLESNATTIFANDASNILVKYAITKERGEKLLYNNDIVYFVWKCLLDKYYHTEVLDEQDVDIIEISTINTFDLLADKYKDYFPMIKEGFVFGTIAVRNKIGFLTTSRYKRFIRDKTLVNRVSNDTRTVYSHLRKATLNAPLLNNLFETNKNIYAIVHFHVKDSKFSDLPKLEYAIPGTVRDSNREIVNSFNIEGHGTFLLLDKKLNII